MADASRKLPVFETVSKAFGYAAGHITLMIKLAWPWMSITVAALVLFMFAFGAAGGRSSLPGNQDMTASAIGIYVAGIVVYLAVTIAAMASIAVEWHRVLLLGETAGWFHLRLRGRALAYFGYMLAIMLVMVLVAGLLVFASGEFGLARSPDPEGPAMLHSLPLLTLITICYGLIFSRLFLVLPGAAVGDRRISFRRSVALTKGNGLRVAGGFVLLTIAGFALAFVALTLEAMTISVPVMKVVVGLLVTALNAFITFVGLSYMSFCYWFLVPPPEEGDLA